MEENKVLGYYASENLEYSDFEPADAQVFLESTWRDVKVNTTSSSTATERLDVVDNFVQTTSRGTIGTQTDDHTKSAGGKVKTTGISDFLKRVEDGIVKELQGSIQEHAILEPYVRAVEVDEDPPKCTHDLSAYGEASFATAATARTKNLVVTSVSWSSSGQTVACSYGRFDVAGWCTDPGALTVWNLARGEINQLKPDVKIETDNCLMTCAFHPTHPALVAGGTFNGELFVWDLGAENDMRRGRSDNLGEPRHRDPIVSIVWQASMSEANKYGTKSMGYRLVTLGADGRVLVWTWHKLEAPVFGYALLWAQPGADRRMQWGGACMSFQKAQAADNTAFLVGTEGGRVFRCWFDVNDVGIKDFTKQGGTHDKVDLRSPIKDADYQSHPGVVLGVDYSPFQADLFVSCSADGSIHLCSTLRKEALLLLEPTNSYIHAVKWSPFRPLVFAAATGDGHVHIYDLSVTAAFVKPVISFDVTGSTGVPVYSLAFNPKRPDTLATGDPGGIRVWQLPPGLVAVRKGEEAVLRKLAAADDVVEFLRKRRAQ